MCMIDTDQPPLGIFPVRLHILGEIITVDSLHDAMTNIHKATSTWLDAYASDSAVSDTYAASSTVKTHPVM
jgi:hypothetical protein